MEIKTKKYKDFDVDFVAGAEQFAHGWEMFGELDVELIDPWAHYQLPTSFVSMRDDQGLEKTQMLYDRVFNDPLACIHGTMVKMEMQERITFNQVLLLLFQLQFPSMKALAHFSWPKNFFLATDDGLRLLYVDGALKSCQLDRRFYMWAEDDMIHVGHWLNGTWLVHIDQDRIERLLHSVE